MGMNNIKLIPDIGAPLAVTAVNLIVEQVAPEYDDYAIYAMTAAGYLAKYMGWGGEFVHNIGLCSMPLSARLLYDRFASKTPAVVVSRRVNRVATAKKEFSRARII